MSWISCNQGHQNPAKSRFCCRCGEFLLMPSEKTAELPPGARLRDRYIIQRQLGRGGFGSTYLAKDTGRFDQAIAIKELTPVVQGTAALAKAEELFQREAAMLHQLQHPQIPKFWEFFREGDRLFLVQDYIEGCTYEDLLRQRLQQGQCFNEGEILEFLRHLLPVLSYLHSLRVIHRDISPDNIICRSQDGLPVLIDLGGVKQAPLELATHIAKSSSTSSQEIKGTNGTSLGKVGYAPDEQLRLGIVAPHTDLYALGVTVIVLMTGKPPQQLIDPQTLSWIWQRELKLSQPLATVLNRMLAPRPSERFHSADEILNVLNANSGTPGLVSQGLAAQPMLTNNSGQGNIFDSTIPVPDDIQGWNWGAFLVPGLWCMTNQVWIGLIAWVDLFLLTGGLSWLVMAILLGVKGNEWAWKSRRWKSTAAFKAHQRNWAIAACLIWGSFLLLVLGVIGLIIVLGMASLK
jgi:serine/threonine protein kinase